MVDEKFLQKIVDFCRKNLEIDKPAKDYLANRGLDKEILNTFQVGSCPVGTKELLTQIDPILLREIGFIRDASYCYFSNYITLPVWDHYGELIAIAGRVLPDFFTGKRKYFNTIYPKGKILYGLNFAIPEIRRTGEVIIVEGHIDVSTAYQFGIKNLVGTCGTALTFDHIMLLSRYAEMIYLVFDSDKAGARAVERVLESDYKGVKIQSVYLKENEDPDSFIRKYGGKAFMEAVHATDDAYLKLRVE